MKPVGALIKRYLHRPLNLRTLNDFNAEFLFTSALVERAGLVDSTAIIEDLASRPEPEIRAFARDVTTVTPKGARWWYGRSWELVSPVYYPELSLLSAIPSPIDDPFHGYVFGAVLSNSATDWSVNPSDLPAVAGLGWPDD